MDLCEEIGDHLAGAVIEIAGGLVGQDDLRLRRERASESHTLLFATRELAGAMGLAGAEADFFQSLAGRDARRLGRDAADQQGHHHVFKSREFRQQGWILPNEPNGAVAKIGERAIVEADDLPIAVEDFSGGGFLEAAQKVEKSRFSSSGLAYDGQPLAATHAQREILEDPNLCASGPVNLTERIRPNRTFCAQTPAFIH